MIREQSKLTVEGYAAHVRARGHGTFQSRALRDQVWRLTGGRRTSIRNQELHPEYVTDYVGTVHSGLGNTQYRTFWSVLYQIQL